MPDLADDMKPSWGDIMEEDEGNELPAPQELIEGNIKKVIEYRINDDGKKCKVTRIFKTETRKVPKSIAQRKQWAKFGEAERDNAHGPDPATTFNGEEVFLTFTTNKEELNQDDGDPLKKIQGSSIVKCRYCKGDHWTTKCPYRDSLQPLKELEDKEKGKDSEAAAAAAAADVAAAGAPGKGGVKYIPPSLRGGTGGEPRRGETMRDTRRSDDASTLRVTNLSEEATEADLNELFKPFGHLSRVFLAKDKITNNSKGFAFVSYVRREDAARAIKSLQGFGYDHLILNVEWAKPSSNN